MRGCEGAWAYSCVMYRWCFESVACDELSQLCRTQYMTCGFRCAPHSCISQFSFLKSARTVDTSFALWSKMKRERIWRQQPDMTAPCGSSCGWVTQVHGVDGMVHISEISYKHIKHPSDVLRVGQHLQVMVTKIDTKKMRIALSLKRMQRDPLLEVRRRYYTTLRLYGWSADETRTQSLKFQSVCCSGGEASSNSDVIWWDEILRLWNSIWLRCLLQARVWKFGRLFWRTTVRAVVNAKHDCVYEQHIVSMITCRLCEKEPCFSTYPSTWWLKLNSALAYVSWIAFSLSWCCADARRPSECCGNWSSGHGGGQHSRGGDGVSAAYAQGWHL